MPNTCMWSTTYMSYYIQYISISLLNHNLKRNLNSRACRGRELRTFAPCDRPHSHCDFEMKNSNKSTVPLLWILSCMCKDFVSWIYQFIHTVMYTRDSNQHLRFSHTFVWKLQCLSLGVGVYRLFLSFIGLFQKFSVPPLWKTCEVQIFFLGNFFRISKKSLEFHLFVYVKKIFETEKIWKSRVFHRF